MAGFAIFLVLLAKFMACKGQNSLSSYISTMQDEILIGKTLAQIQETNTMHCALSCSRTTSCEGVNFDMKTGNCFLIAVGGVREFKKAPGFVYMGMVGIAEPDFSF